MSKHVVIIGGSVGGLGAALGLAKRGIRSTIVERDLGPATTDGDEAFETWDRRHVPQFRQPHGFSARSRNLLLEHAPEVVDLLAADGITSSNFFKELAPRELWEPQDDAFDGLMSRRPAFELAMRRAAEAEPHITFACHAQVTGLVLDERGSSTDTTPVVRRVRHDDGTTIGGDVVLDGGGRRTLVPGWLSAAGAEVPYESQDCETTYHTRYYRLRPESGLPMFAVVTINAEVVGACGLLGFPGDHDCIGVCLTSTPGDDELAPLRENWGFDAALGIFPAAAGWVDPANATPINDVAVMAGNRNIRRHFVVDGRPVALGVLPVGDSLCTTNPQYGWGASMALTYAFAAVDAIDGHDGDLESMALAYDAAVAPEADAVYRESAASDRYRLYQWRGQSVPADDAEEMDRQELIALGVLRGATRDPVLGRAFLRRSNLIQRPDETFDDPEVLERASAMRERSIAKGAVGGPTRADLLAALAAAKPQEALQT
jgi:2-polyprenyl-6-methoxyphenol hydroxylase-like FAD-dependent oxidoreductase